MSPDLKVHISTVTPRRFSAFPVHRFNRLVMGNKPQHKRRLCKSICSSNMTFKYNIRIEISCVTTVQLICGFVFIVWELWKVQSLKIDFVVPWHLCMVYIMKTSPCNVYPREPHFYIAKLGYAGVHLFFLFLLQNIDCGYSLEPPHRGGSNVYPQSLF